MAESAGWATLDVIPSMKGFRSALDRGTARDFAAVGRAGGARLGDEAGKAASGRLKTHMGGALRDLFAPAAGLLAGAGIVAGFRSVVDAASDAQQSVGGVEAVFGRYADGVITKSREAAQALGLSSTAYQELATVSAALLKNKGIADYAEQAQKLLQVGADLAAQYGGSTKDAVEALNAAMRGESDPIERYGVSLNQTAVNAELAKKGLSGLKGAAQQQAQTQARLAIITQQTADAQGAFARESDTLAGAQQRAQAQWANMRAELGQRFLPVMTNTVGFLNDKALPALEDAGSVAAGAAKAFGALPTPIKAAAGALVAFRAAQAVGLTGAAGSGFSALRQGLDDVRLRAMLAGDEYRRLRTAQLTFVDGAPKFTAASGRMSSALGALGATGATAGGALRKGLGGVVSLLGGPWGVAMIAGGLAVGKFLDSQSKAKQRVDDLRASLDEQTGALTKNTRELIYNGLQKSGAIDAAKKLGLNLADVQKAAEGNEAALRRVMGVVQEFAGGRGFGGRDTDPLGISRLFGDDQRDAANALIDALGDSASALGKAKSAANDQREAMGKNADAQRVVTEKTRDYRTEIDKARGALQRLMDKENERRDKNLSAFNAQTRIAAAFRDAQKEAREGTRTLDENTRAGQANRDALAALADAWNSSPPRIKNARGAYEDIRRKFVEVATQMGANTRQAQEYADELLRVPKDAKTKFSTPGMDEARAKIKRLEAQLKRLQDLTTLRMRVIGPGDISREEFGHGVGRQPHAASRTTSNTTNINVGKVEAHDYNDFKRQMQREQRLASLGASR